ncbi:hypothetical protein GCM10009624_11960 [Gordonia sinesedis]
MTTILDTVAPIDISRATLTLTDAQSRTQLVVGTPYSTPRVWNQYVEGAYASYRARGVEAAFEYEEVRDGAGTMMFCAVLDEFGSVVGGLRVQGPYGDVHESHAISEWGTGPGRAELMSAIDARLSDGLIEVKAAFVDSATPEAGAVAGLLARTPLVLLTLSNARYMMATAADYVLARWESGGGRVDHGVPATPYPDDRYQTRVMFWDWYTLAEFAQPEVWAQMHTEYDTLRRSHALGIGAAGAQVVA